MATVKQIHYRMGQAKKKLTKLNKEVHAVKNKVKTMESQLKKAKVAAKAKAKGAPARRKRKASGRYRVNGARKI
jgi:predicted  nucleic acid-binding Zn-ribbon protein